MTKKILTQERLKELLEYNPETGDFKRVNTYKKFLSGEIAGYVDTTNQGKKYRKHKINGRGYKAHRLAFLYMTGEWPELQVDHEDGNGLNNKWSNLNNASAKDNARNARIPSNNKTGCRGVHFCNRSNRYVSRIGNNNKRILLGYFSDIFDAICARKSAENKLGYHVNHGSVRPL